MKNNIIGGMVAIAAVLSAPQTAHSQGTLYLSSVGQPSAGTASVASDSWQAVAITTGNNPGGYVLDSVQLAMASGSGLPNGFTVMLYSEDIGPTAVLPGNSLGTLNGSDDPVTGGIFTYTSSGLTLSPSTGYYIVLTAGTTAVSGTYAWSRVNSPPNATGGWAAGNYVLSSSDGGLAWFPAVPTPQFTLTATAVPEPDTLALLGVAGWLFFVWRRWHAKIQLSIAR